MNNTLHTPAPWQVTFGEYDAAIHNDVTIASINDDALAWKANARLISAAPDLLETLQDICAMIVSPNDTRSDILAHAQKAIAKAKGEA